VLEAHPAVAVLAAVRGAKPYRASSLRPSGPRRLGVGVVVGPRRLGSPHDAEDVDHYVELSDDFLREVA
jgi:hypothetical protein